MSNHSCGNQLINKNINVRMRAPFCMFAKANAQMCKYILFYISRKICSGMSCRKTNGSLYFTALYINANARRCIMHPQRWLVHN
uniref:Uncharacterized protein n=1 Tax=Trichogramma kaykai TaxID=54128 RepID=A0ABD2WFR8_9HYME